MKPAIIAFSGSIASGKSTLSQEVAKILQWKRVSFGDYVRSVAQSRRLTQSREVLQAIGAGLIQENIEAFCYAVLAEAEWQPGHPMIIDGIRHVEVLNSLRQIVAPMEVYLVFVTVSEVIRSSRLMERGVANLKEYQNVDNHSTEQQVKTNLAAAADLTVDSLEPLKNVTRQTIEWLQVKTIQQGNRE